MAFPIKYLKRIIGGNRLTSQYPTEVTLLLEPGVAFTKVIFWKAGPLPTDPILDLTGLNAVWTIQLSDKRILKFNPDLSIDPTQGRMELNLSSSEVDYLADEEFFWGKHKVVLTNTSGTFYRILQGNVFRQGSLLEDFVLMGTEIDIQTFTSNGTSQRCCRHRSVCWRRRCRRDHWWQDICR
jgi:hypothetical protein